MKNKSGIPDYVLKLLMERHAIYLNNILDHIKHQFKNVTSTISQSSVSSFESTITIIPDNIPHVPIYIVNKGLYSLIQTNNRKFPIKFNKIPGLKKPHYYDLNDVKGDLPHYIAIPLRERKPISLNDVLQIVYDNNVPLAITAVIFSLLSELFPDKIIKLQRTTADSDILRVDGFKIDITKFWVPNIRKRIFDITILAANKRSHGQATKSFNIDIDFLNSPDSLPEIKNKLIQGLGL